MHMRHATSCLLHINTRTHTHTHTQQLRVVLQLSEVEMKFFPAHFIVVPLIILIYPPIRRRYVCGAPSSADCGDSTGEWTRVAYINISDPQNSCSQWDLTYTVADACSGFKCPKVPFCTHSKTKPADNGCSSIKFPTFGIPYNKVCGRAQGYQYGFTRAFHSFRYAGRYDLDNSYVSGLSVTRGEPGNREHIWTFAAGFSQTYGYATINCPCAIYPGPDPPEFVGDNYFCDSGNPDKSRNKWHVEPGYRLWNSEGCDYGRENKCCKYRGTWFTTDVSLVDEKESDYIEMRICRFPPDTKIEDIGVDELEIYITEDKKED